MTALYLISPSIIQLDTFTQDLQQVLTTMHIPAFQLRLKDIPGRDIKKAVDVLMPICHANDTAFILNDRPDLAKQWGCDGAHIGKDDMSIEEARDALGADKQLGVSCYDSFDLAIQSAEQGADYVAFGSMFPTTTKSNASPGSVETVQRWCEATKIPAVAIGGITVENAQEICTTGVDFIAVSAGVWSYPQGAVAAVEGFSKVL